MTRPGRARPGRRPRGPAAAAGSFHSLGTPGTGDHGPSPPGRKVAARTRLLTPGRLSWGRVPGGHRLDSAGVPSATPWAALPPYADSARSAGPRSSEQATEVLEEDGGSVPSATLGPCEGDAQLGPAARGLPGVLPSAACLQAPPGWAPSAWAPSARRAVTCPGPQGSRPPVTGAGAGDTPAADLSPAPPSVRAAALTSSFKAGPGGSRGSRGSPAPRPCGGGATGRAAAKS